MAPLTTLTAHALRAAVDSPLGLLWEHQEKVARGRFATLRAPPEPQGVNWVFFGGDFGVERAADAPPPVQLPVRGRERVLAPVRCADA